MVANQHQHVLDGRDRCVARIFYPLGKVLLGTTIDVPDLDDAVDLQHGRPDAL
ncbi:MAG: hypothetical protein P4L99_05520 [Chthoniobacter sp.]|nr:hypothetical protein [Chthoniobacter sp.]